MITRLRKRSASGGLLIVAGEVSETTRITGSNCVDGHFPRGGHSSSDSRGVYDLAVTGLPQMVIEVIHCTTGGGIIYIVKCALQNCALPTGVTGHSGPDVGSSE